MTTTTPPGPPPLADLPPMADATMNDTKRIPASKPGRPNVIAKGVTQMYALIGMAVFPVNQAIGAKVVESAEPLGEAWAELASTNPKVKKILLAMIEGTGWAAVVAAHIPVGLAVLAEYGPSRVKTAVGFADATMNGQAFANA